MSDNNQSSSKAAARKLFASALARREEQPAPSATIPAQQLKSAPLTAGQQRLWFLENLEGGQGVYNIALAYQLRGPVDPERFENALRRVLKKHPVLRVRFELQDSGPFQLVSPLADRCLKRERVEGGAEAALRRLAAQPFDLQESPSEFVLLEIQPQEYILLLRFHHSVFDGTSMDLIARDLSEAYQGNSLDDTSVSFLDFAAWQKDQMGSDDYQNHRAFWSDLLQGELPILTLPLDGSRPAEQDFSGAMVRLELAGSVLSSLRDLAVQQQVSLNMLLLAAYYAVLWRFTGQSDLIVATSVSSRSLPELERTVGFFVNTLPLRLKLQSDWTFQELLAAVRELSLSSLEHQAYPFEQLVTDLKVPRDRSRTPIFQTLFSYREVQDGELTLPGLDAHELPVEGAVARTDLTLWLDAAPERVELALEYATALFSSATADRLLGAYQLLLTQVADDSQSMLGRYDFVGPDSRTQLLESWNETGRDYGEVDLLKLLSRTGSAPAVSSADGELSYDELQAVSDRVAQAVRSQLGGGSGIVGLALERSSLLPAAILGVWKAGCAYLPLDPDFPESRLAFMVSDCDVELLLTQHEVDHSRLGFSGTSLFLNDLENWPQPAEPLPPVEQELAYIIYTSGSTGKPKGVKVGRAEVFNFLCSMAEEPGMTSSDVLLAVTTLSFDISVLELCLPLSVGGRVHVVPREQVSDAGALIDLLETTGATMMQATPSTWQLLLAADWAGSSSLKVLSGGEPLRMDVAQSLVARVSSLWNMYGPTETTVWSTCHEVKAEDDRIYIGRPIGNTQVYVLDEHGQPVPVGVEGELYIGGLGVTQGYHNRSELTEKQFPRDELGSQAGRRVYRTGDLVRWDAQGRLEYVRRVDTQVKLRGYRIELGEIEAALGSQAGVDRCAVSVVSLGPMDERLVAYLTASEGGAPSEVGLRKALRQQLPGYMVPQHFVTLEAMPLTANNKIDRKALPQTLGFEAQAEPTPLETDTERKIASVWSDVLGRPIESRDTDFFDAGGHSLVAMQIAARLTSVLQQAVTVGQLFQHTALKDLAAFADEARPDPSSGAQPLLPSLEIAERDQAPLTTSQQRLWFLENLEGSRGVYNIAHAFELQGSLDSDRLESALREVVGRHPVLRVCYRLTQAGAQQSVMPASAIGLNRHAFQADLEASLGALAAEPLNLDSGPPCAFDLYTESSESHILLMRFHHSVFDGASAELFMQELSLAYTGELADHSAVPSYLDYAVWQQGQLDTPAFVAHREYWLNLLSGELPSLNFPAQYPRPAEQDFSGGMVRMAIQGERLAKLKEAARSQRVTLNMLLLASYYAVLWRYTGQSDLIVATSVSSRSLPELDRTVGFFVNTLPLRLVVEPGWCFRDLAGAVRALSLAAMDHQDYPFEQLVNELNLPRDLSRTPVFQTLFSYREVDEGALSLTGVKAEEVPFAGAVSRTDISLWLDVSPSHLDIALEYASALFSAPAMERFLGHFDRLLDAVVSDAQVKLADLPMLGSKERTQLLESWNETGRDYGEVDLLKLLSRTGSAPAVSSADGELSYDELQAVSDRVAQAVRSQLGGGSGIVGLALERSSLLPAAILGVWKAGCAYLPLDPDFPESRLAFMVSDCDVELLLTQHEVDHSRLGFSGTSLFLNDLENWPQPAEPLPPVEQELAYIIYTSGSTGKPKGVKVGRAEVFNFLCSMAEEPGMTSSDVLLAVTTLSFDISVLELCLPLSVGGRVHVVPREQVSDAGALIDLLETTGATMMQATPSTWQLLLAADWAGSSSLKVLSGGEPLRMDVAQSLVARVSSLWNMYGPTETTVWSTCHEVKAEDDRIYIGRPIGNTQVYVLDEHGQPVPVGVEGELYIGGLGVTQGYHNRSELTEKQFPRDELGSQAGRRVYRTGDLVRWDAQGRLEYVRRVDTQVKLRGYRIELGEIEAALGSQAGVDRCAVSVVSLGPMDERLVAYLTASEGGAPSEVGLRKALRQQLPGYMVPQHFVTLEAMPLTANNKIDRKALPQTLGFEAQAEPTPLETDTERKIASIWADALKRTAPIGRDDNFFELGGHSLLSLTVLAELESLFQAQVPIQSLVMESLKSIANQCDRYEVEPEQQPKGGVLRRWFRKEKQAG